MDEALGLFNRLPKEIMTIICAQYCTQTSRVMLSSCNRILRQILWDPVYWNKDVTIACADDLILVILRHRKLFAMAECLRFGPRCQGLRPSMLAFIAKKMPKLKMIDISRVYDDKLFLFGFHVFAAENFCRNPYWYESKEMLDAIKRMLQSLRCLRINLVNYSLGLYMLLDRFKNLCPALDIRVSLSEEKNVWHKCTPRNQYSIYRFMTGI